MVPRAPIKRLQVGRQRGKAWNAGKHVGNVNTVVETEMSRFEKVVSAIEKHQVGGIDELKTAYETSKAMNDKWRVDFEDT